MNEKQAESFYQGLHKKSQEYSAGEYYMPSLFGLAALRRWFEGRSQQGLKVLDVGCGKGLFLRDFLGEAKQRWGVSLDQVAGIDIVRSPGDHFAEVSPQFEFRQQNLDGAALPFSDGQFDLLFCNHVLEHVFETEVLLKEFRRVLAHDGLCIVSVPNIAAWVNRVGLLFAGQPLGSELGTKSITYGFWPAFLQKRLVKFKPSGHIRDFTPRGLRDLTRECGFVTVGWWSQSPGLLARLGKWAGRAIGIVLQPSADQTDHAK